MYKYERVPAYIESLIYDVIRHGHIYYGHHRQLLSSLIALKQCSDHFPSTIHTESAKREWYRIKEVYRMVQPRLFDRLSRDAELQKEFREFLNLEERSKWK